jgi:hypothetical protein
MPNNISYINWKKKILRNSNMTLKDTIVKKQKKQKKLKKKIEKFTDFYGSFNDGIALLMKYKQNDSTD